MKKTFLAIIAIGIVLSGCSIFGGIFAPKPNAEQRAEEQQRIREKQHYEPVNTIYKPKNKTELIEFLKQVEIPIENIDVSEVEDFSHLFDKTYERKNFSGIEKWNPKKAKKMHFMFADKNMMYFLFSESGLKSFPKWYMDFVKKNPTFIPKSKRELREIFKNEERATLAEIDVSNIDDLSYVFNRETYARDYLAGLENWDVSNVVKFDGLFYEFKYSRKKMISDISNWNTKKAKSMKNAFFISSVKFPSWYVEFVKKHPTYTPQNKTELVAIIDGEYGGSYTNQVDISLIEIDISKINDLSYVFCFAKNTNGCREISRWNRKSNYDFSGIEFWDVSNVENMERMFMGSKFNENISKWDVSRVLNFYETFARTPFSRDISSWKINKKARLEKMFFDSELEKQDKLPIWAK